MSDTGLGELEQMMIAIAEEVRRVAVEINRRLDRIEQRFPKARVLTLPDADNLIDIRIDDVDDVPGVPYLTSYTPVVDHEVQVLSYGAGRFLVLGQPSENA